MSLSKQDMADLTLVVLDSFETIRLFPDDILEPLSPKVEAQDEFVRVVIRGDEEHEIPYREMKGLRSPSDWAEWGKKRFNIKPAQRGTT